MEWAKVFIGALGPVCSAQAVCLFSVMRSGTMPANGRSEMLPSAILTGCCGESVKLRDCFSHRQGGLKVW